MTSRSKIVLGMVLTFLLGAALPVLVMWNPAGWAWVDQVAGHRQDHTGMAGDSAEMNHPMAAAHPAEGTDMESMAHPASEAGETKKERKVKYWRGPMDPNYISDKPGKSPMGMDLVPVYEDEGGTESGIHVDPSFLQNFAVRTATVEKGSIPIEIRTVGILAHNPNRLYSVNTKFEGWIEKSYYNNIGEYVKQGDVLFEIYSPALVTTQLEYLAALDYLQKLSGSAYPEAVDRARSLLEAARERLRYWDITDQQIGELERSRTISRRLKIFSPFSGYMIEKMADSLEGMKLMPGMTVYKLADHSKLWTEVELFEYQIQHLRIGQSVRVEVDSFPGRTWRGRIVLFDSAVNPQTRTLTAYVEIDNKDLTLRPQMYANIIIRPPGVANVVKVPQEAIIHSGEKAVVIIQKGQGVFEPRVVELGPTGDDYQAVHSGLLPGDVVVTSSQFLIDSESNLKAAISQMLRQRSGEEQQSEPEAPPMTHQH